MIVVSFMPVFLLEAQEGRMFRPLALTKTFAVAAATLLAITLVPALMALLPARPPVCGLSVRTRSRVLRSACTSRPAPRAALEVGTFLP